MEASEVERGVSVCDAARFLALVDENCVFWCKEHREVEWSGLSQSPATLALIAQFLKTRKRVPKQYVTRAYLARVMSKVTPNAEFPRDTVPWLLQRERKVRHWVRKGVARRVAEDIVTVEARLKKRDDLSVVVFVRKDKMSAFRVRRALNVLLVHRRVWSCYFLTDGRWQVRYGLRPFADVPW